MWSVLCRTLISELSKYSSSYVCICSVLVRSKDEMCVIFLGKIEFVTNYVCTTSNGLQNRYIRGWWIKTLPSHTRTSNKSSFSNQLFSQVFDGIKYSPCARFLLGRVGGFLDTGPGQFQFHHVALNICGFSHSLEITRLLIKNKTL